MEVCRICHQEIKPDQKYRPVFLMGGKVHIACADLFFKDVRHYLGGAMASFWIGMILLVVGIVGEVLGPDQSWPTGGSIAMLVIGACLIVLAIGLLITLAVKLHGLRKHPIID